MYNPYPYLPQKFQAFILWLKARKLPPKLVFFVLGSLATLWFLIRVIPKPSRAAYPCMQATAPFMSGFVLYMVSLGGAATAFTRFRHFFARSQYAIAFLLLFVAGLFYFLLHTALPVISSAGNAFSGNSVSGNTISGNSAFGNSGAGGSMSGRSAFPPNDPIGTATGIFPGRVVWMWNPDATNKNCTNTSNNNGVIDPDDDAWFMEKNNNLPVIDSMVMKLVMALTGVTGNAEAWDLIFKYFNSHHGKGNTGYAAGEKIFIKVNATSAYGGISGGHYNANLGRTDDLSVSPFLSETDPYLVLSVLRQLVQSAMVPEDMIYVGDPARNIYKEFYDLWHDEFPGVHILGNNLIHPELAIVSLGRLPVVVTASDKVFFSDQGTVMTDAITDKLFTIFEEMDYLINIPAMKAHSTAGITLAAKNHFGSFTRTWALHLHSGLMDGYDDPTRLGYGLYRVQTDIMMHNLLSGKNLLIIVDGLYPGEDAGGVPEKWLSIPFGGDWCSSIFMSLDPVAVESVCHDFLRTEYNGPTIAESRPNWFGVDDYLHQAADSSRWAEGIVYDPDNDGILIPSLGVHEHWNDSLLKQYTRNLGTGNGIELIKVHDQGTGFADGKDQPEFTVYPNPTSGLITLSNPGNEKTNYEITDQTGKKLFSRKLNGRSVEQINLQHLRAGTYFLRLSKSGNNQVMKIIKF